MGTISTIENGKALVRNGTELVAYPSASGSITLASITAVDPGVFFGNANLTSVSFPAATSIGRQAFAICTSLTSVSIPSVTSIDGGAFGSCNSLASVTLGNTATTVGSGMFPTISPFFSFPEITITIRYPAGATGYGIVPTDTTTNNWGNAFRGIGWDGRDNAAR